MFCNNCGNLIREGERFCVKCGAKAENLEATLCEKCGAEISDGAKFCGECGTSVTGKKEMFCSFCGEKFDEGDAFCKKCGNKISRTINPFANIGGFVNKSKPASRSTSAPKATANVATNNFFDLSMIIKLSILLCAVLLIVFTIVPVIEVEIPVFSFFGGDDEFLEISLINPFYNLEEIDSDFEDIAFLGTILSIVQGVAMLVLLVMILAPIFKKSYDTGVSRFAPIIFSSAALTYSIAFFITFCAVIEEAAGNYIEVSFTFGAWIYVIIAFALLVLSICSYRMYKKSVQ